VNRNSLLALIVLGTFAVCLFALRNGHAQSSTLRRITSTSEEGINLNPSISGDGRVIGFESTEDLAAAGGSDHFRAIRASISSDPAAFFQMAGSRAVAPAVSQDGSRIAFASKDDPLGINADGNSEIFLFDGAKLIQVTNTSPGSLANRITNGNFQPSISDDGRFIAFSSNRDLANQNSDGNLEIFVYDTTAGSFTQLTNSTGIVGFSDAKISGDGSTVA
jgi:Tol biopolymer transport system component